MARRALEEIRERVLDGARIGPGDRVVDLGAGTGLLATATADRGGGAGGVYAVGFSAQALSCVPAPVTPLAATLTQLSYATKSPMRWSPVPPSSPSPI